MNKLIVLIFILSKTAIAEEKLVHRYFDINNKKVKFVNNPKKHLTINEKCHKNAGTCIALKKIKLATYKGIDKQLNDGGKDPGAVICKKTLFGKLIYAEDRQGNGTVFCKFKDGSLLGTGSISFYAQENDSQKNPSGIKF